MKQWFSQWLKIIALEYALDVSGQGPLAAVVSCLGLFFSKSLFQGEPPQKNWGGAEATSTPSQI